MAFVPKTRPEIHAWLLRFHDVGDSLDFTRASTIYAKDTQVQFGNRPVMKGMDALGEFFKSQWTHLVSMKHDIDEFDMVGDKIYQSCHITWQVKGDPEKELVKVPAMAVYHLVMEGEEAGLIAAAEYYMDPSSVAAAFGRVSA